MFIKYNFYTFASTNKLKIVKKKNTTKLKTVKVKRLYR